jgi:hypothetical protein
VLALLGQWHGRSTTVPGRGTRTLGIPALNCMYFPIIGSVGGCGGPAGVRPLVGAVARSDQSAGRGIGRVDPAVSCSYGAVNRDPWRSLARRWRGVARFFAAERFTGQRLQYELSQLIPLAVMVLIGLLFYALGRRTRQ